MELFKHSPSTPPEKVPKIGMVGAFRWEAITVKNMNSSFPAAGGMFSSNTRRVNTRHSPEQPFRSCMWLLVLIQQNIGSCPNFWTCCWSHLFLLCLVMFEQDLVSTGVSKIAKWKYSSWDSIRSKVLLQLHGEVCCFILFSFQTSEL